MDIDTDHEDGIISFNNRTLSEQFYDLKTFKKNQPTPFCLAMRMSTALKDKSKVRGDF